MKNIKVMTYNIQHCLDYKQLLLKKRIINIDMICDIIQKENPDIIGLNEVYNDVLNIETVEQVKYIANKLGYKYFYFGKSIIIKNSIEYGNAILSKYPINNIELIKIDDPIIKDEDVWYESRSIIKCNILIDNNNINVFVTHLGLANQEQINGVNKLLEIIDNSKQNILIGDFNMESNNLNIKKLNNILEDTNKYNEQDNCFTYPSINGIKKIDYIFINNIKCINSYVVKKIGSDHLPVVSNIEI